MKSEIKRRKKNFMMLSNKIAKDPKISLKAKGMCTILAHVPENWQFYEEQLQDFARDGRTSVRSALIELEENGYLHRKQLREKGRFSNKLWTFNDEGLVEDDFVEKEFTDCRKTDIGKSDIGKETTSNTHSKNTPESNTEIYKKSKRKKRAFYDFVNKIKNQLAKYPDMTIEFQGMLYGFVESKGQYLLIENKTNKVLSKNAAETLYQKMANSLDVKINRIPKF